MAEEKNDDQNGAQDDGVFDYEDLINGLSGDEESGDGSGGAEEAVNIDDIAIDEIIGDAVEETRAESTAGVPKIDGNADIDLSDMFDDLDEMARDSVTDEGETEPQPQAQDIETPQLGAEDEMQVFDKSIELDEDDVGGSGYASMLSEFGGGSDVKEEPATPEAVDLGVMELDIEDEESVYASDESNGTDGLELEPGGDDELAIETMEHTGTVDALQDEEPEDAGDEFVIESAESDAGVTDDGGQTSEIEIEEESGPDEQSGISFDEDESGEDQPTSLDDLFGSDDDEESSEVSFEGFGGDDEEEVEEKPAAAVLEDEDVGGGDDFLGLGDLSGGASATDKFAGTTEVVYDGIEMEFDEQISAVTLAEVYLAQGKREEATEVYTTVAENKGITGWVAGRLRELGILQPEQPEPEQPGPDAVAVDEEQDPEPVE